MPSPHARAASPAAAPRPQAHVLRTGELLRLPDDAGALIAVVRGRVWLTRANDPDDHFLDAGRTMRVAAGALALLSAEGGPAEVLVYRDAARPPAREVVPAPAAPRTIDASVPMPAAPR